MMSIYVDSAVMAIGHSDRAWGKGEEVEESCRTLVGRGGSCRRLIICCWIGVLVPHWWSLLWLHYFWIRLYYKSNKSTKTHSSLNNPINHYPLSCITAHFYNRKDYDIHHHSYLGNPSIFTLQLSIHKRILIDNNLTCFELQDHKGRNCVDFKRTVCSSHRPRIEEIYSICLGCFEVVRMATDEQFHSHFLCLVAQCLFVAPRNDLMTVDHADAYPAEFKDLCY